jgi:hypothetical protein
LDQDARVKGAIQYADTVVRQTQSGALPIDQVLLQRSEGAMRLFTMFMTEAFKFGNRVMFKYKAWQEGAITGRDYMRYVIYENFASPWLGLLTAAILRHGDLPEWWEYITTPVENFFGWIPVVRDVVSFGSYKKDAGKAMAFEGVNRAVRAAWSVKAGAEGKKEWSKVMWDVGRAIEFQLGVPALKLVKDMEAMYDNATGNAKKRKR